MAADCIADDIKANNHKHNKHNKHTHISCFPALAGRSIWPASHVYCQSTQAFSSHSPNFTHTTTTTETSRTLARAGILQHVYFALLDFPHNISDLVWGTQSAQSNYYTSNPTGPHITHPTIIFLHLLTMVPSTSFGTSQVLPDPIFFLNESYQKIYILRINQTLR